MAAMIKIFGERNTSTNALKAVIEKNSSSRVAPSVALELDPSARKRLRLVRKLRLPSRFKEKIRDRAFLGCSPIHAWKHSATRFEDIQSLAECHVIFCVRHPASWLLGLYKRPHHIYGRAPENFREFLDKRWKTVQREGLGRAEITAPALYNLKAQAFADLQPRLNNVGATYSVVRHEDFAIDQGGVFAGLAPYLLEPSSEFCALESSTKDKEKTRAFYKNYYGNELWREEIDAECAALIREQIDWSAVESYGYQPI